MILHPWPALEHAARTWPNAEALVFPHQSARRSFAQYHAEALALAGALHVRGLRAGDHVALLAENRVEWAVVQMACAALGAVFVPLNTHYRKDDLAYALKQSDSQALICSTHYRSNPYLENVTALRPSLPLLAHVFTLEEDYPRLVAEGRSFTPVAPDPRCGGGTALYLRHHGLSEGRAALAPGHDDGGAQQRHAAGIERGGPLDLHHPAVPLRGLHSQPARLPQPWRGLCRRAELRPRKHVPHHRGRALHASLRRADLLSRHARSSRARRLRPLQPEGRKLRRGGLQPGCAAALRGGIPHAGPLAGLWPDRGRHAVRLSRT